MGVTSLLSAQAWTDLDELYKAAAAALELANPAAPMRRGAISPPPVDINGKFYNMDPVLCISKNLAEAINFNSPSVLSH